MIDSIASQQHQIAAAVTKKALDVTELKGAAVLRLLESAQSVQQTQVQDPALGNTIDITV